VLLPLRYSLYELTNAGPIWHGSAESMDDVAKQLLKIVRAAARGNLSAVNGRIYGSGFEDDFARNMRISARRLAYNRASRFISEYFRIPFNSG